MARHLVSRREQPHEPRSGPFHLVRVHLALGEVPQIGGQLDAPRGEHVAQLGTAGRLRQAPAHSLLAGHHLTRDITGGHQDVSLIGQVLHHVRGRAERLEQRVRAAVAGEGTLRVTAPDEPVPGHPAAQHAEAEGVAEAPGAGPPSASRPGRVEILFPAIHADGRQAPVDGGQPLAEPVAGGAETALGLSGPPRRGAPIIGQHGQVALPEPDRGQSPPGPRRGEQPFGFGVAGRRAFQLGRVSPAELLDLRLDRQLAAGQGRALHRHVQGERRAVRR